MKTEYARGQNYKSMILEELNYGSYEFKDKHITFALSENEKAEFKTLADNLGLPVNLLIRVLMRQAVAQYNQGLDPIPGFKRQP